MWIFFYGPFLWWINYILYFTIVIYNSFHRSSNLSTHAVSDSMWCSSPGWCRCFMIITTIGNVMTETCLHLGFNYFYKFYSQLYNKFRMYVSNRVSCLIHGPQGISNKTEKQSYLSNETLMWNVLGKKIYVNFAAWVAREHLSHMFLSRDG